MPTRIVALLLCSLCTGSSLAQHNLLLYLEGPDYFLTKIEAELKGLQDGVSSIPLLSSVNNLNQFLSTATNEQALNQGVRYYLEVDYEYDASLDSLLQQIGNRLTGNQLFLWIKVNTLQSLIEYQFKLFPIEYAGSSGRPTLRQDSLVGFANFILNPMEDDIGKSIERKVRSLFPRSNLPPVAVVNVEEAEDDTRTVYFFTEGDTVTLSASESYDPDAERAQGALTYQWNQVDQAGGPIVMSDLVVLPEKPDHVALTLSNMPVGDYYFQADISDGVSVSKTEIIRIVVIHDYRLKSLSNSTYHYYGPTKLLGKWMVNSRDKKRANPNPPEETRWNSWLYRTLDPYRYEKSAYYYQNSIWNWITRGDEIPGDYLHTEPYLNIGRAYLTNQGYGYATSLEQTEPNIQSLALQEKSTVINTTLSYKYPLVLRYWWNYDFPRYQDVQSLYYPWKEETMIQAPGKPIVGTTLIKISESVHNLSARNSLYYRVDRSIFQMLVPTYSQHWIWVQRKLPDGNDVSANSSFSTIGFKLFLTERWYLDMPLIVINSSRIFGQAHFAPNTQVGYELPGFSYSSYSNNDRLKGAFTLTHSRVDLTSGFEEDFFHFWGAGFTLSSKPKWVGWDVGVQGAVNVANFPMFLLSGFCKLTLGNI
ncbi:MAG TPA: hypothetical protein DCR93_07710 [Cytophagales bacterium]|nr:hypothetical protein [Cytophagales bacterium]HAP59377.1 hypothetical protein [Cytophagales bacterium]